MSFFKMKSDRADTEFSIAIRKRDKRCVRCGRAGTGQDGIGGLTNSHFFGRSKESVRFDPDNCDALCIGCHMRWEHEKIDPRNGDLREYGEFKFKQLGMKRFNLLEFRAHRHVKKDRKMSLLMVREFGKSFNEPKSFGAKA